MIHSLFLQYQTIFILHEINTKDIRVQHSQINRFSQRASQAFKASPFDSSLQTTRRETVDSRLQARSSFGRATFHLQGGKTSLTPVSSSMLSAYTRERSGICRQSVKSRTFATDYSEPLRHLGLKRVVKYSDAKVLFIRKIMTTRLLYHV